MIRVSNEMDFTFLWVVGVESPYFLHWFETVSLHLCPYPNRLIDRDMDKVRSITTILLRNCNNIPWVTGKCKEDLGSG